MENNNNNENNKLSGKELYELGRLEKTKQVNPLVAKGTSKRLIKIIVWLLIIGGGIGTLFWYITNAPTVPEEDIISREKIHWHPELSIYIKGEKIEIPKEAGTSSIVHTHDTTGTLHLHPASKLVRKDTIKLGKFFELWDKQFSSTCILDSCNGDDGTVKMFVNGNENTEFENYLMQEKDKIEIRFE